MKKLIFLIIIGLIADQIYSQISVTAHTKSSGQEIINQIECKSGFCMTYENAAHIELALDDIKFYLEKIESGDTKHNWLERIDTRVNEINQTLNP